MKIFNEVKGIETNNKETEPEKDFNIAESKADLAETTQTYDLKDGNTQIDESDKKGDF